MKSILNLLLILIIFNTFIFTQEVVVPGKKPSNTVITYEQYYEKGFTEFGKVAEEIDGLHNVKRGKSSLDINLRGFMKDNINILPNGEKIYGACPNRMDPPSTLTTIEDLKYVEVIKGPYDVKNQGGMGGSIYTEPRDIEIGLKNQVKLQTGSYGENIGSFRSAYGSDSFKIAISGSYQSYYPYKDGKGKSITSVYPDLDHPLVYFPIPATITIDGNSYGTTDLKYKYPYFFPEVASAPSSNRYEYNSRNNLTIKRTANLRLIFSPSPHQEIELQGSYASQNNSLTPYLLMDMIWDDLKRGSIKYTLKNLNETVKKLSIKFYGNEILHDMTDSLRCSSYSSANCVENIFSREYGMRSWAESRINGVKLEAELALVGKTTLGIDQYLRRWNIETTTRMPYPATLTKQIPSKMSGMSGMSGMMSTIQLNYRTQGSLPDVSVNNIGIYAINENEITSRFKQEAGLRYDHYNSKAKKDRRILYNIYYPVNDPILNYQYASYIEAYTIFDAEVYLPQKKPSKEFGEGSGYIKWVYELSQNVKGKLGLGYGVRFPDPQELYFAIIRMGTLQMPDFVGNPFIKPSRNREIDLGISYKKENSMFDLDLFYSNVGNYIIIRNTPDNYLGNFTRDHILYYMPVLTGMTLPAYINSMITTYTGISTASRYGRTYKNVDAILYGGEATLKYELSENYLLKAGLAYTRGINKTENTNLAEMPPLKGKLGIRYTLNNWFTELQGIFANTQSLVDKNIGERRTGGWGIANLLIGYEMEEIKFNAGINNLFNRYYSEHLSYVREPFSTGIRIPEPGRNIFASVEFKF